MIEVSLSWVAQQVQGTLNGQDILIDKVSTDTRSIEAGSLFIALKGPNFDAHDFVELAQSTGAAALLVSKPVDTTLPFILVEDTKLALGELGKAVRNEVAPKTVGITGSSGKTTVKEMVASILSLKGNVLATKGNFNNDIGVPLTLLQLEKCHEYAVVEMGANHLGEINYTCSLAQPDVSTIVNASAAHLEGFGSLFGVARAKSEIFNGLQTDGLAILNKDSQFFEYWSGKLKDKRTSTFSMTADQADFYPEDVIIGLDGCAQFDLCTPEGKVGIWLTLPGIHNVNNALVAAALAMEVGASLEQVATGLRQLKQVSGRLNVKELSNQIRILDDTYNANVASVNAALDVLSSFPGRQIAILGDMGELGEKARYYHEKVGEYAQQKGINDFYSLGVLSQSASDVFGQSGHHFSEVADLVASLNQALALEKQDITILIKGSRSARMENVVKALEESPLGKFERARERIAC